MPSTILKETDKYIDYQVSDRLAVHTHREQKFLCVGGPFDGQYYTYTGLVEVAALHRSYRTRDHQPCDGYHRFNNAGGDGPNCIYVWVTI